MSSNGNQQREINALKRSSVHVRMGTVTDIAPLSVKLGAADEDYIGVKSVGGASLSVGDIAPVLKFGSDILVLGGIGDGIGGGGGGPFQPLSASLTTLGAMGNPLAQQIVNMTGSAQELLGAGGASAVRAIARDTSYHSSVIVFGHSINYTGSSGSQMRNLATRLGTLLHTDARMLAIAGGILSINSGAFGLGMGGWEHMYRNSRGSGLPNQVGTSMARGDDVFILHGINDVNTDQPEVSLPHTLRAVISRFCASNIYEEDDGATFTAERTSGSPTLTDVSGFNDVDVGKAISGTGIPAGTTVLAFDRPAQEITMSANASSGSGTVTTVTITCITYPDAPYTRSGADIVPGAPSLASEGYYATTTTVNRRVRFYVPDDFRGGTVAFAFLSNDDGDGALWEITDVDSGGVVGTIDTRGINNSTGGGGLSYWTPAVFRITGLAPGKHVLEAKPTAVSGMAIFDCCWLEADDPPLVQVALQFYGLGNYAQGQTVGDFIDELNEWQIEVVSEFDENVFTLDTEAIIQGDVGSFSDVLHLNDRGQARIAAEAAVGFAAKNRTAVMHGKAAFYPPFIAKRPQVSQRNVITPNMSNVVPLTLRAANSATPQNADLLRVERADESAWVRVSETGSIEGAGDETGAESQPFIGSQEIFSLPGSDKGFGAWFGGEENRVIVGMKGTFDWAPGLLFFKSAGVDSSNLYLNADELLKTDGDFEVAGDLIVGGSVGGGSSTNVLDLSKVDDDDDATTSGSALADKISFFGDNGGSGRYGLGMQFATIVAYVGAAAGGLVVSASAASGEASGGVAGTMMTADGRFRSLLETPAASGSPHTVTGAVLSSFQAQAGRYIFRNRLSSAVSNYTAQMDYLGKLEWGDGSSAVDVSLYRSAANVLKTDDSLHVALNLAHLGSNLGFFGVGPVTQRSAYTQTYATTTRTNGAPAASGIVNSFGTANGTMQDVGTTHSQAILNNNFRECSDQILSLVLDVAVVKQLINSLIDDLQAYGLAT